MELHLPAPIALLGLRALRAVVLADGVFDERERALLAALARALHLDVDVGALAPATAAETAAGITDPVHRERLVQALLITALIDGGVTDAEATVVDEFARVLEVDEPRVRNLHHILDGHLRWMQFDLMRRSPMVTDVIEHEWRERGTRGVWKNLAPLMPGRFLAQDDALAARYLALEHLPEDTFGRHYFEHLKARGFTFPGQKGGFPEGFAKHDFCHVLGDYDTDPAGECEVVAFIAGFLQHDPFGYLFMIFVHCHLDVVVFQGDPTGHFAFDVDRVLRALQRGMAVNRDLYDVDFDWWPLLSRPIADVRAELGIGPR
jgi:tellurite resistance protein